MNLYISLFIYNFIFYLVWISIFNLIILTGLFSYSVINFKQWLEIIKLEIYKFRRLSLFIQFFFLLLNFMLNVFNFLPEIFDLFSIWVEFLRNILISIFIWSMFNFIVILQLYNLIFLFFNHIYFRLFIQLNFIIVIKCIQWYLHLNWSLIFFDLFQIMFIFLIRVLTILIFTFFV